MATARLFILPVTIDGTSAAEALVRTIQGAAFHASAGRQGAGDSRSA